MAFQLTASDVNFLATLGHRAQVAMHATDLRTKLAAADSVNDETGRYDSSDIDAEMEFENDHLRAIEIDLLLEAATIAAAVGEARRADAYISQAGELISQLD